MTREVRDLLSWAILEMSGHRSESSTPWRPHPSVILMLSSQEPKKLLQPVYTSSQVSAEMAEVSLEGIPTSISPIAVTTISESVTPLADAKELHVNANKALEELLITKAFIDTCRQRTIWELGMELHCNKSKATESIKEAKAICFQANLDAQALCFTTIKEAKATCLHATLEAKAICLEIVKEAKMTCTHSIWENKATCSMAIRAAEARKASHTELLQKEHGDIMLNLERQVIQEEVRSQTNFLSTCQATMCTSLIALKSTLVTFYHIWLGQTPPSPPFVLLQRASPVEEQLASAAPSSSVPKQSPQPKRQCPSPDLMESMPLGGTTSKTTPGKPPSSKQWETLPWKKALKPSHTKAFRQDSDLVKEAREAFFSKHSYNFVNDGTRYLSKIFHQMSTNAELLGT